MDKCWRNGRVNDCLLVVFWLLAGDLQVAATNELPVYEHNIDSITQTYLFVLFTNKKHFLADEWSQQLNRGSTYCTSFANDVLEIDPE